MIDALKDYGLGDGSSIYSLCAVSFDPLTNISQFIGHSPGCDLGSKCECGFRSYLRQSSYNRRNSSLEDVRAFKCKDGTEPCLLPVFEDGSLSVRYLGALRKSDFIREIDESLGHASIWCSARDCRCGLNGALCLLGLKPRETKLIEVCSTCGDAMTGDSWGNEKVPDTGYCTRGDCGGDVHPMIAQGVELRVRWGN